MPKKEQHRSECQQGPQNLDPNGKIIAPTLDIKEQEANMMTFTSVHPMETLLVQQLEHLLIGEKELRTRYSRLNPAANTPEMRMAFSQDVAELKDRADRLSRLMDAMNYYTPSEHEDGSLRANAIA